MSLHRLQLEGWRLSSIINGQLFNQSCPCSKVSINSKGQGLENFWIGEHVEELGECCTHREHETLCPFPHTLSPLPCPMHLFHLVVLELYHL